MIRRVLVICALAISLAACVDDADEGEFADESELKDEAPTGKADELGNYDYFTARLDLRKCVSPLCGGIWIDRVNRVYTRCGDGSYQRECYVADVFVEDLGWSDEDLGAIRAALETGRVVLRGAMTVGDYGDFGALGQFDASEVWLGGGQGEAAGLFTRVRDNGIRCITTPCGSLHESKLNSTLATDIAGLDLEPATSDPAAIERAFAATASDDGLLVAGYRTTISGQAGEAKAREVREFYTRFAPAAEPGPAACVVTGCSGQVCAEESVFTTCEWLPQYACYATATCERQAGGECGWTETAELDACLADI